MKTIFENAKFGDKFQTELGLVLFVEKEGEHYLLLQDSQEFRRKKRNTAFLKYDADGTAHCRNRGWDIIKKLSYVSNIMTTIEERAEEFATSTICFKLDGEKSLMCEKFSQNCICSRKKETFEQYIKIATEQHDIDIEKTCNWLSYNYGDQVNINEFRYAMEGIIL